MIHNDRHTSKRRDALSQLFVVTTLMTDDMQRGLTERGLTLTRAQVLWILGDVTRITQRELAQRLRVTPRNVTALIDALEATGFVRRSAHPTDRRAVMLELTPQGQMSLEMLQLETEQFAMQLLGDIPDADLVTFKRVLDSVGAKLSAIADQIGG
jgi:DNA-binding MarR family transcriptional regulator